MNRAIEAALALVTGVAVGQMGKADSLRVTFDSGHPAHVVAPGCEEHVALVLTNSADRPARAVVHVEVESFDGAVAQAQVQQTVPAGHSSRWLLPRRLFGDLGIKWVRFWIEQEGINSPRQEASFAYMQPAGPTEHRPQGLLLGIAYGAGPDNHAERAAQRAALCGVKIARGHPVWPRIQPKPDQWDWSSCDAIVDAHANFGIEVQFLLSGAPRWSWQSKSESVPRVDAWEHFCRELAKRYQGRVRYYELWNEPDIGFFRGTQEQYIELLRAGYQAIKKTDPSAKVTSGGFASWSHGQTKPGMVPRVISECQDSYDLIAYHRHGEFSNFRSELEEILLPYCQNVLRRPKPLYFTETGMDTRFGQRFQACTFPKKVALAWSCGAVAYTWFNLHDMRAAKHPLQPGFTYGLFTKLDRIDPSQRFAPENMDYDHAWPKAVYVSYNTLASLLANKRFHVRYQLGRDQYAFVFSSAQEHVVLAWSETAAAGASHLVLATDAERVDRVDLMGNRQSRAVVDGRTVFALTKEPAYLVLSGGQAPRFEGQLAAPTSALSTISGRALPLEVEVWNPLPQPVTLHTQWRIPKGIQAAPQPQQWTLKPDGRQKIALEATVPANSDARFGQVFPCTLEYRLEPVGWPGKVVVPVTMGAVVLQHGKLPGRPTFRLDKLEQVVNLSEHDPHTVHLLWNGRQDLSANVRLARVNEGIQLQAEVQDDIHHAPSGQELTKGDHVELFLQIPGQAGIWRVLLAHADGKSELAVVETPGGFDRSNSQIQIHVSGQTPRKQYSITLPDAGLGLSEDLLQQGIRLNLRLHDHDGRGHKGWLQLAPGEKSENAHSWPLLKILPRSG